MPIKAENRKRYPSNWKDIRADILERAHHKCEFCGIENYTTRDFSSYEYELLEERLMQGRFDEVENYIKNKVAV